jgi:hypothetical protein
MLLAIPGDNTFANYQEANRTFWRQTVLPLVARTCEALSTWLAPAYAEPLTIRPDTDSLDALSSEREALWTRLEKASFLTTDEKRAAVGYAPMPASTKSNQPDLSFKYPGQPRTDGGQFDFGKLDIDPVAGKPPPPKQPAPSAKPAQPATPPTNPVPIPPGKTIRNQALAGQKHPDTGIPFDTQGFPDFSAVATNTVSIPHTGNRVSDESAANAASKIGRTPDNMTWHHHQDGRTMQLVPKDIHSRTGHTGSIGIGNTPGKKK